MNQCDSKIWVEYYRYRWYRKWCAKYFCQEWCPCHQKNWIHAGHARKHRLLSDTMVSSLWPVECGLTAGECFGELWTGFASIKPLRAAAFSARLPKPMPEKSRFRPSLLSLLFLWDNESLNQTDFLFSEDQDRKWGESVFAAPKPCWTGVGRTPLACSRHEVTERLDFAFSRNIKPKNTLRQPIEKRKNAETRVKVSTWWERIAAPIL